MEPWTLAILPDTQNYMHAAPATVRAQTRWLAESRGARNIAFAVHLGDVVDDNGPAQWRIAREAFGELDGRLSYAIALGNHDYGAGGAADSRHTLFGRFFPPEHQREAPTMAETFARDRLDNSAHLFAAGGRQWLVLVLEFGPRDQVLAWADEVLARHRDRAAIVVTHAYLYADGTRYDARARTDQLWAPGSYGIAALPGGVNDGERLWRGLLSRHGNVVLVLCGHVANADAARLTSVGEHGNRVHQVMSNYQMLPDGGSGYLRLMEFSPARGRVRVETYSPTLDRHLTDPGNRFELEV